ncbi:MAG: type II toxin-antitoxin system Phd/YefM family antitoxin [Treponema sp.]|nr:type II toxin-antitoxin system Phd/YefM family antitoxin [Treponema sp.]
MRQVSVGEAKNKLPYFLHLAEKGEQIQITRHGKMVACINGAEQNEIVSKKKKFLDSVQNWRAKNAEWLLNDSEANDIFARSRLIEKNVRHPEDFE